MCKDGEEHAAPTASSGGWGSRNAVRFDSLSAEDLQRLGKYGECNVGKFDKKLACIVFEFFR